jgi:hypothetical protein
LGFPYLSFGYSEGEEGPHLVKKSGANPTTILAFRGLHKHPTGRSISHINFLASINYTNGLGFLAW